MPKKITMARLAVAALCAGVLAVTGTAYAAEPSGSHDGASASPASATNALGVVAAPGGWLEYTHTLASKLRLQHAATKLVKGSVGADGTCRSTDSGTAQPGAAATFEEEVAVNPMTCETKVIVGALDANDVAILNTIGGGTAGDAASQNTTRIMKSAANTTLTAMTTSYASAYTKTAWIDPVNITITSLASNITWPLYGAGGTVAWSGRAYDFPYDGWSSTGVALHFSWLSNGVRNESTDSFTNSDFAALVYAIFGAGGWLACGAQFTTTAHFNHDVTVIGYDNGGRGWAWNDAKSGACANLVHHGSWNGYGTAS